jgi:SusD family.
MTKWTNLTDAGQTASNTADGGVNTDYPMFRLADVYLMYAEAVLRGGNGGSLEKALEYVNDLRERAYGNKDGDLKQSQLSKDLIIDERARELYLESERRTDLIRFGEFTTSKYLWQWKGGTKDGMAVDNKYNIYPIPNTELTANPNLYNENY